MLTTDADSRCGVSAERPVRRAGKRKTLYVIMREFGGKTDGVKPEEVVANL